MIIMAGREAKPIFPVGPFYVKDCTLHGFAMFNASPEEQRQRSRRHQRLAGGRQAQAANRPRAPLV